MSPSVPAAAASPPKFKRHARNYLLDSHFQLKYTGYIVGLTLLVSLALGFLLYVQTTKTVEIGNEAVRVGDDANKAGQDAVKQSQSLTTIIEMGAGLIPQGCDKADTMEACGKKLYADSPMVLETMKADNQAETDKIEKRAKMLEASAASLEGQRQALGTQRTLLLATLAGVLTLLVVLVGLAGIFVTHRIAGPIFKMKRLLREVGEGKLVVQGRLRKGDELHDFFEVFATMVERLRLRQEKEIEAIDGAITLAESSGADAALLAKLRTARNAMQGALEA